MTPFSLMPTTWCEDYSGTASRLTVASVAGNLKTTDALWNGALNANWSTSDTMAVRASKAAISATFIRMAMRTMALSRPRYLMAP